MPHATCMRCTRIFLGPFCDGDLLPDHLDALMGLPCLGSRAAATPGAPMPFHDAEQQDLPAWPIERR